MNDYLEKIKLNTIEEKTYLIRDKNYLDTETQEELYFSVKQNLFSDINFKELYRNGIEENRITEFVETFNSIIIKLKLNREQMRHLPKWTAQVDEDVVVFNWQYNKLNIYIAIDAEEDESFFSISYRDTNTGEYQMHSAKLKKEDYLKVLITIIVKMVESISE